MVVGQHESRNVNLTGKTLQKSSFFSQLVNKHADKNGIVYLQSKDLNRLTRDIYIKGVYDELISVDYISSTQEQQIINELLEVFKDQQIQSQDLTKDEWNSVFWDDIFARPDIQTAYANEVIKYDEKENKFKYDAEKDRHFRQNIENKFHDSNKNEKEGKASFHWFSLFKARARGKTLSENNKTAEIKDDKENNTYDSVSVDDFNKAITKENINIKWTGMKFEQKDLSLYRLNTKNLNSSNEIFFKRVVVSKHQTTQKIEIKAAHPSGFIESYIDPNLRYIFENKKMSFLDAEGHCFGLNGHLVTVDSMFENMFLNGKAASAFADSLSDTFWIGATDTIKAKTWSWIDNSSFSFSNWVKEQPKNTFDTNCAAALMQSGKWISDNCEKQKPFICEFKTSTFAGITLGNQTSEKPASCLETWTFYNTTGYCYKAFDNSTWLDAENRCNINEAHLTSIHSKEENLFVANLAYWSGADVCDGHFQGLVGLFRQEMSAQWQWTDGTAYDYQNWAIGHPNNDTVNYNYGYVDVAPICNEPTGKLRAWKLDDLFSKFICKKLPT